MSYSTLLDKQVALDNLLAEYHVARQVETWNDTAAQVLASQFEHMLQERGQRHRVTIVSATQGYTGIGVYHAIAAEREILLQDEKGDYQLSGVTRIEFKRSEMPGMSKPAQTDGELAPLTDAEARKLLRKS